MLHSSIVDIEPAAANTVKQGPTPASVTQRPVSWITSLLSFKNFVLLLLMLTAVVVLMFALEAARFLPVMGENMYPETAGVVMAHQWAHGMPLYRDYRQPPYLISAFPPLWYAILAVGAKVASLDLDGLTLLGRVFSLISLLGIAMLAYMWNRRSGLPVRLALLSPGFYLALPVLIPWGVTARPDFPALLFSFLAVYLAQRASTSALAGSGIAAGLAFLMRHNAVAAPVAVVLWLAWTRKWKQAALFCGVWALCVAPPLLWFYQSSHAALALNLSGAKFGPFALTYAREILSRLFELEGSGFALALFALGVLGLLAMLREQDRQRQLLTIYLFVSLGLAFIGSAAAGGGVNHYLEPALAMALLVPIGLAHLEPAWSKDSPYTIVVVVLVLALLLPALDIQRSKVSHRRPEDLRPLLKLVQAEHTFTDDGYLAARSNAFALDLSSLMNTQRSGGWAAWSSAGLTKRLQEKQYQILVLRTVVDMPLDPSSRYPRTWRIDSRMRQAITENYGLCYKIQTSEDYGPFFVYAPLSNGKSHYPEGCSTLKNVVGTPTRVPSVSE